MESSVCDGHFFFIRENGGFIDSSTGDQLDYIPDAYTTSHYNYTDFQVPPAEFNDVYSDYGEDTDDDGLYNYLTIDVGVNVTTAGSYQIIGYLDDNTGYSIDYKSNTTYLSAGSQIMQLNFEGMKIRQNEVNGPYDLKSLYIYDSSTGDQLDYIYDAYTTSHYNYTDFQVPPAEFNDVYSDYGEDTDDDGLYNYLTIDVDVNVTTAGSYRVIGYLYDNTGYSIDYKSNTTYLSAGSQIMQLNFEGVKIRQNEANGPYDLKSLYIYDSSTGDQLDYIYDAYTTSHYNYTDFQVPPAEFNDVYSDYGEDTDDDGLYNYLTIDVDVNVTTAGSYRVIGYLCDNTGYSIDYKSNTTYLSAGSQIMQLNFEGMKIRQNEANGPYDLKSLYLYDSLTGDQLDYIYDAYTTSHYNYTDFQVPPAEFNDVYSDYGEDSDDDGLYNYLTIDVGVNVTNSGNYQVSGELYETETYNPVCHVYKSVYLTQGTQTVQLKFDGIKIRDNDYNGTFDLKYLQLYSSSTGDQLDYIYDACTTSYYNYTDFQEFPRYIGVAPCAELWNIKVLNQYGYGYDSWIIDGIEYAAYGPDGMPNTGDEADIISMSLGGGPTDGTDPLSRAVNDAVDHGLVVVVAAGNSGTDYFTVSSPGTASNVITVGASTKYDELAWFSSCGPTLDTRVKPDVLAPGVGIIAPRANRTSIGDPINEYYTEASGTSMATPHVAGAAALMLQAHTDWNPWSVKNALISTADDLGYNAYKQGGGRMYIPSAVNTKISVDPATISFVNSSDKTITFRNIDAVSHTLTLDVVVYEALADNQVDCASLNRTSLDIAPGSSMSVLLTIDAASLPKSMYSGKVIANIDSKEQIHAIFGFSNLNEVRVNKINMTGSPASGDLVMVFSDTKDGWMADGVTDENGTVMFRLPNGIYNIISGGGDVPGASVYTIKENISIEVDMNIALDERDAKIIDFDCNKAEQIMSEKYDCVCYYGANIGVGFGSSRGYTDETKTYITPTNSFKSIFSYSYYPEAYYNGSDTWLINTPEWHKILYNLSSVTEDVTFVADYDHLVERTTDYKVALEPELASCWYHVWHPDMLFSIAYVRRMNTPQSRVEWLSPEPISYFGGYEQYTEWWNETYPNWNYYTNQKYPAGTETHFALGGHPLKSGAEIYMENGYLEIYGYVSEDVFENRFANYSCDVSGNLTIIKDGETIRDHESVQHYFQEYVYFSGMPRFDVVVYGNSSPNLSTHTKTELGFTADPTSDYRPPNITISVVDSDMYNCVTGGNVKLNLTVNDETSISSVDLKYSINNGSTWDEASIMQINGNEWMVNIVDLNGSYVSIMANAADSSGNSISHTVINGFYVSAELPALGDVNHDGMLSTVDALLVLQMASGIDVDPAADVNDNGQVTSLDALMILQAVADAI
ncbi:MAG: S8 family serine peptidase [Euryarchaeota archaeon]|nr:S8 family serine peptidase [Euryarchaeota archaeon]